MANSGPAVERRLFQLVVLVAALVPVAAGVDGALVGPAMIRGVGVSSPDLQSHFRYLSGLLLGIGIGFMLCALDIERRASLFRALGFIVITGGLARLIGVLSLGLPGGAHRFALVMELGVMPALILWLGRFERRSQRGYG